MRSTVPSSGSRTPHPRPDVPGLRALAGAAALRRRCVRGSRGVPSPAMLRLLRLALLVFLLFWILVLVIATGRPKTGFFEDVVPLALVWGALRGARSGTPDQNWTRIGLTEKPLSGVMLARASLRAASRLPGLGRAPCHDPRHDRRGRGEQRAAGEGCQVQRRASPHMASCVRVPAPRLNRAATAPPDIPPRQQPGRRGTGLR